MPGPTAISITTGFVNVQSLGLSAPSCPKLDEVHCRLSNYQYDVFGIVETWLPRDKPFPELDAAGYGQPFRCDRGVRSNDGGGVALYVKQRFSPVELPYDKCGLEIVAVELSFARRDKLTVLLLYSPPKQKSSIAADIERYLAQLSPSRLSRCVLLGDFNVDWLSNSAQRQALASVTESLGFSQMVAAATHNDATCIDLAFVSDSLRSAAADLRAPITDKIHHCEVATSFHVPGSSTPSRRPLPTVLRFRDADYDIINSRFADPEFAASFRKIDIDLEAAYAQWSSKLHRVIRECVPSRSPKLSRFAPWFTKSLRSLMAKRDSAFRLWKKSRDPASRSNFEKLRKQFRKRKEAAKSDFVNRSFEEVSSEKAFWQKVQHMSGKKRKVDAGLSRGDGSTTSDPREKASLFASAFARNWNASDCDPIPIPPTTDSDFEPFLCRPEQLLCYIQRLPNDTSPGTDTIPSVFLKKTAPTLAPVLCDLFNWCLRSGRWPSELLESDVVPIFKSGSRSDPNNYRPISLLNLIAKFFERHLQSHLTPLVENRLSNRQWAFRARRSTTSLLIFIRDWILRRLDRSADIRVEAIFFDLRKAFDQVPWHALVKCLADRFDIPPQLLNVVAHWLFGGRRQRVRVDAEHSDWTPVVSGVPQGSILGPLFFAAYIDSISELQLSNDATLEIYADDIVYLKVVNRRYAADMIDAQRDVDTICRAIESLRLAVNPSKTQQLTFSLSNNPPRSAPISVCGVPLTPSTEVRYLGVKLVPNLSSAAHVDFVSKKARCALGCVFRNFHKSASRKTKAKIYTAVVRPQLEYACQAWHLSGGERAAANQLESVQRFAARICTNAWRASGDELLSMMNWPQLETRRRQLCARQMYNFYTGAHFLPPGLISATASNTQLRRSARLNTTHSLLVVADDGQVQREQSFRTVHYQQSFFPATAGLWNADVANATILVGSVPTYVAALPPAAFKRFITSTIH